MTATRTPTLSLILCSRNDSYMGNSRWRLETTLNYTARRVAALGREDDVEIVVSDWGSEVPLSNVLRLEREAARIVSFLHVTPAVARDVQRDSPFPEVIALNAAARRARGQYIGRIDQDTLVGERFLRWLFDSPPNAQALYFANRRNLPYRLAVLCPRLEVVERFIAAYRPWLTIETGRVFHNIAVGIWLLHREIWGECGGYDERMIYMNDMEIDMIDRLMTRYPMVNLGTLTDYDFYHLDHYHPRGSRSSSTHRQVNSTTSLPSLGVHPNGERWGLRDYHARLVKTLAPVKSTDGARRTMWDACGVAIAFVAVSVRAIVHTSIDMVVYPFYPRWKRRASLALTAIHGQPVPRWPRILRQLWLDRPSARGIAMR